MPVFPTPPVALAVKPGACIYENICWITTWLTNARKYLIIFVSIKNVCVPLGLVYCFLLQACIFGNAVQMLWLRGHRENQGFITQL